MIIGMAFEVDKETILQDHLYQELEQKLLAFGGREMVYMPIPSRMIRLFLDQGQTFDGLPVMHVKGKPSHCHENVEMLWSKHKDIYQMVHGYALSPDGLWRHHSWLLDNRSNTIIETTVSRVMYYGVMLPASE